jgi:small conductance mechanosensitive channel
MQFSLMESILYTVLVVGVLLVLYILLRKLNEKLIVLNRNKLVMVTYIVFSILFLIIVYLGFIFWNTTLFEVVGIEWSIVSDVVSKKVGALIASVLVLIIGLGLVRIIKVVLEHSQDSNSVKNTKRRKTIVKLTTSILDYSLKIIVLLVVLAIWGVNVVPAIAGLGILGLVIGFGAQDLMKDFIAGFFIIFEKHFDVGDIIEINGFKGEVIDIGLKTTKVMNWKKDIKLFNNASVQNAINYSFTESMAIVEVGISYDESIERVIKVINEQLPKLRETNPEILEDPSCVGVINFSSSSIDLRVVAKTATEKQYGIERILRKEIKRVFDENDVSIPFSQIVLHHANDEILK